MAGKLQRQRQFRRFLAVDMPSANRFVVHILEADEGSGQRRTP